MTEKMKTICVGRFLVDVPEQAELSLSHERIGGFRVDSVEESEPAFLARMTARQAGLAASGAAPDAVPGTGLVGTRELAAAGMLGRAFVYDRSRGYMVDKGRRVDMESVSVEVHRHLEGLSFTLSATSVQEADASEAEALLARLQVRAEEAIPPAAGFCVWRAVFAEPLPPHDTEHISMHVGVPGHPDVAIVFASLPGGGNDEDLLERVARSDGEASADDMIRVTKLRVGKRNIGEFPGEEVLERVRERNFATTYAFTWETRGIDDDLLRPFLSLELLGGLGPRAGGKPVDSSLHEDAVLALWQSISSSIRLRPSDPRGGAAPQPGPPGPELGAVVRAGEACPRAGWWRCGDGGPDVDVHGGRVQFVRKDERMPQALLLPHQTVWQKLRGVQPTIEPQQPSEWRLVDRRQRPRSPSVVALAPAVPIDIVQDARTPEPRWVPLGTLARTGERCPASGWWRCEEQQAVDGTRWFPWRSQLPVATFHVPSGGWGRAAGLELIQRRSSWQLVRHATPELPGAAQAPVPQPGTEPAPSEPPALA